MSNATQSGPAAVGRSLASQQHPAWRAVNITPAERAGRIVMGLAP